MITALPKTRPILDDRQVMTEEARVYFENLEKAVNLATPEVITITGDTNLEVGQEVYVDSPATTITLPSNPNPGDTCWITVGNFTDTVAARNGSLIMALDQDMTLNLAYRAYEFRYINSVIGWRVV